MITALPQPSMASNRSAYYDEHYDPSTTPSLHSSTSSISSNNTASNFDLRAAFFASRPLTPQVEEMSMSYITPRNDTSPKKSLSNASSSSPRRFRFGRIFSRRHASTPIEVEEMSSPNSFALSSPSPPNTAAAAFDNHHHSSSTPLSRRPSLPTLLTSFPAPRGANAYARKPLPAPPSPPPRRQQAQELSCRPCYYFNARHCHGWVLGGTTGDACETCLQAGFFGEK